MKFKIGILLIFLAFFVSCSTVPSEPGTASIDQFMTMNQIKACLTAYSIMGIEAPDIGPEWIDRLANAIPLSQISGSRAIIPRAGFSGSTDLRGREPMITDQGQTNRCTAYALAGAMGNLLNRVDIDPDALWMKYQRPYCSDAIESAMTGVFANDIRSRVYKLTSIREIGGDIGQAVEALSSGYPVYTAIRMSVTMLNGWSCIGPQPEWRDGGHAVVLVGHHADADIPGGGYFIMRNSWGDIGDSGYQYLPFSYFDDPGSPLLMWVVERVE